MKYIILFFILCNSAIATVFTDLKFGQYQIADSQWNVSACTTTATCQIYSKVPGVAYKIPFTSGSLSWAAGDYVAFTATGDATNPWEAKQYTSSGVLKATMGTGHIAHISTTTGYFFFIGNDNWTGQLFSMQYGMNNTTGVTWTGILNPTVAQVNQLAASGSTSVLAPGQSPLCCGASAAVFPIPDTKIIQIQSFTNRTSADSQVHINQIGNDNTIIANQTGSKNNYIEYNGNGSFNNSTITQTATSSTIADYIQLNVNGNNNTTTLTQNSNGGLKAAFVTINNDNNNLTLIQKDSGDHYAKVNLYNGNKTVNILQQGAGAHMADIALRGDPVNLDLTQSGVIKQALSIDFTCATAGGCQAIQVQQGQ